ncbi:MAG: hypothetical protein MUC47_02010 [Candidatus Kapabacteria bacterium]|jgi:erythronate-4-phosphate dehydrogenase|nr:hypothetical protein [Candidatus Kapabacteria bacterium]
MIQPIVAIDDRLKPLPDELARLGATVIPFRGGSLTNAELRDKGITALLIRSTTRVHAGLLEDTSVQFVGTATSGTDHIDHRWCVAHGITVVDARGSNANAVAEWVLSMLVHLHGGLEGQTLGVVGVGHVGRRVVSLAQALGMNILTNDPPRVAAGDVPPHHVPLEELLQRATIVSLHVPFIPYGEHPTLHLLSAERLALMPRGSVLINAARGGIVDEAALKRRLKGESMQAILDTFDGEPDVDASLVSLCTFATPHVAGHTVNGFVDASRIIGMAFCNAAGLAATALSDALDAIVAPPALAVPADPSAVRSVLARRRPLLQDSMTFLDEAAARPLRFGQLFSMRRAGYPLRPETYRC